MNAHRPIAANDIHPAWCTCRCCTQDRRRAFRLDLLIIFWGAAAALVVGLALLQFGPLW